MFIPTDKIAVSSDSILCTDQPYFQYFEAMLKSPPTDWHKQIAEAILHLYDDLETNIAQHTYIIRNQSFIESQFPRLAAQLAKQQVNLLNSQDRFSGGVNIEEPSIDSNPWEVRIHPISFSIPSELIEQQVPSKAKPFCRVIPGNKSTYFKYDEERNYYDDIRHSLFTLTYKKAGWDCMRHYEILAMGSLPLFLDIEFLQEFYNNGEYRTALAMHPIRLYKVLLQFPGLSMHAKTDNVNGGLWKIERQDFNYIVPFFERQLYSAITMATLQYTKNVFSSTAMANYVLKTVQKSCTEQGKTLGHHHGGQIRSILYLSNVCFDYIGDYLIDTMLHGFRKLLGEHTRVVVNFSRRPSLMRTMEDFNQDAMDARKKSLYGFGMTFGMKLDSLTVDSKHPFDHLENKTEDVVHLIQKHQFDLIILSSGHRIYEYSPTTDPTFTDLWSAVCQHYARHEVVIFDGSDHRLHAEALDILLLCGSHVFSREGLSWERIRRSM
jgi:hypothetical protein